MSVQLVLIATQMSASVQQSNQFIQDIIEYLNLIFKSNFWSHTSSSCISCPTPMYDPYEDSICPRIVSGSPAQWVNTLCPSASNEKLFVASSDAEFDLLQSYLTSKASLGPFWVSLNKSFLN